MQILVLFQKVKSIADSSDSMVTYLVQSDSDTIEFKYGFFEIYDIYSTFMKLFVAEFDGTKTIREHRTNDKADILVFNTMSRWWYGFGWVLGRVVFRFD
jgi:hypothetical protein